MSMLFQRLNQKSFKSQWMVILVGVLSNGNGVCQGPMIHNGEVTIVYETKVDLVPFRKVLFETRTYRPGVIL